MFVLLTRLPIQYSINRSVGARQSHVPSGVCLHVSLPIHEYVYSQANTFHTQMFVSLCEFNGFYGEFVDCAAKCEYLLWKKIQKS